MTLLLHLHRALSYVEGSVRVLRWKVKAALYRSYFERAKPIIRDILRNEEIRSMELVLRHDPETGEVEADVEIGVAREILCIYDEGFDVTQELDRRLPLPFFVMCNVWGPDNGEAHPHWEGYRYDG